MTHGPDAPDYGDDRALCDVCHEPGMCACDRALDSLRGK